MSELATKDRGKLESERDRLMLLVEARKQALQKVPIENNRRSQMEIKVREHSIAKIERKIKQIKVALGERI